MTDYAIGVDVGGTNFKCVAVDRAGGLLLQETHPTGGAFAEWAAAVKKTVMRMQESIGREAAAIGLATPGVIAADGLTVLTTGGKMPGLDGVEWSTFLDRAEPVRMLNDAHAALLGETWIGAGVELEHVVLLTLGTGVGGAIMADGRLLRGWRGLAGHLGHVCVDMHAPLSFMGTPGALECAIGEGYLAERTNGEFPSTQALVEAYNAGSQRAAEIWLKSVHALASAITSFINALDPQAIILGGGIARAGEALFRPLQRELDRMEFRPDGRRVAIIPAQLSNWAGAYGAARNAFTCR